MYLWADPRLHDHDGLLHHDRRGLHDHGLLLRDDHDLHGGEGGEGSKRGEGVGGGHAGMAIAHWRAREPA